MCTIAGCFFIQSFELSPPEHGSDHGYTCDLLQKPSKFEINKLQKEKNEVNFN